jgi:glycosyl transferase family 25
MINNFFNKIFVINLQRCSDRKNHVEKIMSEQNVDFDFVEAVDGEAEFKDHEYYVDFLKKNCYNCNNWNQSKAQLGCWLSHIKIWEKIVAENIESCLILEDDFLFNKNASVEETLKDLPKDWNIFMAGYGSAQISDVINDNIVRLTTPSCTHAYALKYEAAKIILDNCYPLMGALDSFTGHIFFTRDNNKIFKNGFETRCNFTAEEMQKRNPKYGLNSLDNLFSYAPKEPLFTQGGSNYSTI